MKRLIPISILFLLISFLAHSRNYFREGTRWIVKSLPGITDPDHHFPSSLDTLYLSKMDKEKVYGLYCAEENHTGSPELLFWIKTHRDKVYFRQKNNPDAPWYLMYDFGLKPGKGTYVYRYLDDFRAPARSYMKCVGIEKSPGNPKVTLMRMSASSNETSEYSDAGFWIKGIGSQCGIEWNDGFSIDGANFQMWEVSEKDRPILSFQDLAISWTLLKNE